MRTSQPYLIDQIFEEVDRRKRAILHPLFPCSAGLEL